LTWIIDHPYSEPPMSSRIPATSRSTLRTAFGVAAAAIALVVSSSGATAESITEFPIPTASSYPWGIAAGPDGNLWFVEGTGNKIGRITTAGVVTEFSIPTAGAEPRGITAGPDGNLWFTEESGNKIGRITPAGVITEFPLPTPGAAPFGITAGPDGNLWFTEQVPSQIGRITPAGVITEFSTVTPGASPFWITTGPDGNLWFTEEFANNIARITPAGVVTEFPIPTAAASPWEIVTGPDGNLWFTEFGANQIGRISPNGANITEFPLPTATSQPLGITADPDGNLWFTEYKRNKIGRITPAGIITEFTVPTPASNPVEIAPGSDGNLWFTETNGNNIGRVVLTIGPPPSTTVSVTKAGTGSGTVTGPGIVCGTQCSAGFNPGLTLAATAAPGSSFKGWSGACTGTGLCVVATAGNTTVTAAFERVPAQTGAESGGANGPSAHPSLSADGQLVAFDSAATNLAAACTSGRQIFLRDRTTGVTTCVSVAGGAAGNGVSTHPALSADGQVVAFDSTATNLAGVCTSGVPQIFVIDRVAGTTSCVSVAAGAPGDGASTGPVLSADGRRVAFTSTATNLASPCTTGVAQIFLFDRGSGTLTCLSTDGVTEGDGPSGHPAVSGDGRFVAFHSAATNLADPCNTAGQQIFVHDQATQGITCESLDPDEAPGNGPSANPALDGKGAYLAYESTATNLAAPCTGGQSQIYVRDRTTGLTRCRSVDGTGAAGTGASTKAALSGNGRRLVFVSQAPNIVSAVSLTAHGPRQGGDTSQVVGEELDAPGAVSGPSGSGPEVISTSSSGVPGSDASDAPAVSGDGSVTGFQSTAPNLVPGTTPGINVFTVQAGGRARLTAPVVGSQFILDAGPTVTFSWTPLPGVSLYGFEFTGPNRQFSNPNGAGPDPVNGFGGAGGGLVLPGTSFVVPLGPGLPVGAYQVRVLGLTAGATFSDALTIVLGAGNRPVMLSPADHATLTVGSAVTFGWTPVGGAALYGFEFTGPNRQFANPNGTGPDPVNGFGGAGGAFVIPATGFTLTVPPGLAPGSYQARAIGISAAGSVVGVFSDAVTFIIP
jgi:streptogramin lyase/Tol biopolymer transport system component